MSFSANKRKIGIAISTHNREDHFKKTYPTVVGNLPVGVEYILLVVDDASANPYVDKYKTEDTTVYRFEECQGVAVVKNKAIEILYDEGCTDIFLFDDDVEVLRPDWWKFYVYSGEDHMQHIFSITGHKAGTDPHVRCVGRCDGLIGWSNTRGVMLYLTRKCVETVGGMHVFSRYGGEHRDYSIRAHNLGMSTWKYTDVAGSEYLFKAYDHIKQKNKSTVGIVERNRLLREARIALQSRWHCTDYEHFRTDKSDERKY